MELQHHGFNGKLFDGLFFVVWLICMYRNGLLHQRETSTHKAAKSVGPHVYFQVGSPKFVPNGYMDYSCISLQSPTLAVDVVFLLTSGNIRGFATTWQGRHVRGERRGTITIITVPSSIIIILVLCYRSKLNSDVIFLCWVDFEFP